MTGEIAHLSLSELIIERPKSTLKVRDSSEIGAVPFYTSGVKIARHTEALCSGENIYIATGGKANFQFLDGPAAYSTDTYVVTGTNRIETKYLYYFLTSQTEYIGEHLFRGSALRHLSRPEFKELQVPLPSLPEQQRIVHLLDEAFEGITIAKANAEKNLQSARAIFESYLETSHLKNQSGRQPQMLGDLCRVKTGKKDVNEGNPKGVYPFFTCAENHTFSDSYSFDTEALLIAGNGNVGQVEYFKGKFEAYQRTYVLDEFRGVTARYLFHILKTQLSKAVSKRKLGTAMPYIKKGMLTDYQVYVPTTEEQEDACEQFDDLTTRIDTLARLYEQKVRVLEELKNSVMARSFSRQAEVTS